MPDPVSPPDANLPPPAAVGPKPPPRARQGCLLPITLLVLFFSLLANLVLLIVLIRYTSEFFEDESTDVEEKYYLGDKEASDKVAVVRVEGLISESGIAYPVKQLENAAKDKKVKVVVLRIDSPGGSVSASDELYHSIINLRDDTNRRFKASGPKPVVVSMGGLAASGGYYIAVAGSPIYAERTTITGSIGVFAALPNVADLAERNGVHLELIKAGRMKASGSFFHKLSQPERQTWQDTVDNAYDTFLGVIEKGRPTLTKDKLRNDVVISKMVPARDFKGDVEEKDGQPKLISYSRVRADGATFTAEQAKQFGLIDDVGDLPAAIQAAVQKAGLKTFKAVSYSKAPTLLSALTGMKAGPAPLALDPTRLGAALTPRLWYLAPSADGAILAAER